MAAVVAGTAVGKAAGTAVDIAEVVAGTAELAAAAAPEPEAAPAEATAGPAARASGSALFRSLGRLSNRSRLGGHKLGRRS